MVLLILGLVAYPVTLFVDGDGRALRPRCAVFLRRPQAEDVRQHLRDREVVRVEGAPVHTPTFSPPSNPGVPTWSLASSLPTDVTYVLDARRGGEHGIQWTINGVPWGEHTVTELPHGAWTRVRFQNDSARLHPMHVHGQFFKVIAKNGQPVDEPFFRDTVLLHGRETIDVGMVPLDWGRWMMHCHILEHAEAGMMTEIDVHKPQELRFDDQ